MLEVHPMPLLKNNTQIPKMPTPLKPPPGWEDHHEVLVILFLSKGADLNGLQFAELVFPPNDAKIRYYANQKIQNHASPYKLTSTIFICPFINTFRPFSIFYLCPPPKK
jgi:hypothetical protein